MITVSVITPCLNSQLFIADCISSVQKSITLDRFKIEHILMDDGSSDDTVKLITSLHSSAQLMRLPKTRGASFARNMGLSVAKGKYIFFLDADDVIFQHSLRLLFEYAEKQQSGWLFGDFVRGSKNLEYQMGADYVGWQFYSRAELLTSMYTGKHFFQQNNFFLKSLLDDVGGFNTELEMAEDFDLCTRLAINGTLPRYIPGPLYMHRLHEKNISNVHLLDTGRHKSDIQRLFKQHESELAGMLSQTQLQEIKNYFMDTKV